jgi:MSHA biogenesis protein MshJ
VKALKDALVKVDALSVRERLILFVLLLAGIWAVVDTVLLTPQAENQQIEQQKLQTAQRTLAEATQAMKQLASQPDPNQADRQRLERARNDLITRMEATQRLQARMVAPKNRVSVLQGMLAAQPGLRLISLDTFPAEPVGIGADATATPADQLAKVAQLANTAQAALSEPPALFKHGLKLTLVGNYNALTQYMERLERLPVGFYWLTAELDASAHPEIALTLVLYTLSLESTWLTV